MANRVLRDQCEHGRYESHYPTLDDPDWASNDERSLCPGGREVTEQDIHNMAMAIHLAEHLLMAETPLPIAWCYTHNAVRDHHVETERCDIPRSLLFRIDAALREV